MGWLRSGRSGAGFSEAELRAYRDAIRPRLAALHALLDRQIAEVNDLRHRTREPDQVRADLLAAEAELEEHAAAWDAATRPAPLRALHTEYRASFARARRGIATVRRGCGMFEEHHRAGDDAEPHAYWKRGHQNMVHARMRMGEIADVLLAWKPGRPAEASVASRLHAEDD